MVIKRISLIIFCCISILFASGCDGIKNGELIIKEGKNEINMAISGIDSYNPLKTKSRSVAEMLTLIYDPLFEFDESLTPVPCLAKEISVSADRLSATLTLQDNIKWHSGASFTAEDVVYTINRIKNGSSLYSDNVAEIIRAEAIDNTVVLTLGEPVMNIEGLLSFPIVRNGLSDELLEEMDGTGAFYVAEKRVHDIKLLPNKEKDSSVSAVNVTVMRSDTACVNAFQMRETDFVSSAVLNLNEKTPAGEIETKLYTTNQMTFLGFNCLAQRYSEPSIRLAVTNMIDRAELCEKAVFSKATECKIPFNPKSSLYFLTDGPEMDVDGILEKAGYTKSGGKYLDQNGVELRISVLVNMENSEKLLAARLIKSQLEKNGIAVELQEVGYSEYKERISSGQYDTFIGEIKMRDNLDPSFLTKENNMFGYSDTALSEAIAKLKSAEDTKSAVVDYERAFSLNPPFAPLYYRMEGVVYEASVSGITEPSFYNSLIGLEKVYFKSK